MGAAAAIGFAVEAHPYDEKIVGIETRIDGEHAREASKKKTGAREQNHRGRDLRADDDRAESVTPPIR